jgi:mannitol/fructose-specific phosphotransferase system IIA component
MNFRRFLSPEAIHLDLETTLIPEGELPEGFDPMSRQNLNRIRESVIGELSELLASTGEVTHPNRLLKDLLNREKKAGTATGSGIAFPHVRTLQVKSFIMAFGRSREGLPFDAPDDEPVHLFFAMAAFNGLVIFALYQFATGFIRKFARRTFELQALVALGILVLGLTRAIHELSFLVAPEIGGGIDPSALWYLAPIAGGAMLARILMNSETALIFTAIVAAFAGVMMGDHVLYSLYFVVAGVTASGSMAHTRERVNVLRAGLQTALMSAATAMLLGLVQAGLAAGAEAPRTQALWDMGAAFTGGLASAILVLGFVPLFEVFGFTTD